MRLLIAFQLLVWNATAIRLPRWSALDISSRLKSESIKLLFDHLDINSSAVSIAFLISIDRLGLVREYTESFKASRKRIIELATWFSRNGEVLDYKIRNRLFNHEIGLQVMPFHSDLVQPLSPLLLLDQNTLLRQFTNEEQMAMYMVLVSDAASQFPTLINGASKRADFDALIMSMVRLRLFIKNSAAKFDDQAFRLCREFVYIGWALDSKLKSLFGYQPDIHQPLIEAKIVYCKLIQDLPDFDHYWNQFCFELSDEPSAFGRRLFHQPVSGSDVLVTQLQLTTKCENRILFAAALIKDLTQDSFIKLVTECGNGLFPDGHFVGLIEYLLEVDYIQALVLSDMFLDNCLDPVQSLAALKLNLDFPETHPAIKMANDVRLMEERGFLCTKHSPSLQPLDAVRRQTLSDLICGLRDYFIDGQNPFFSKAYRQLLLRILGQRLTTAIKLRLDMKAFNRYLIEYLRTQGFGKELVSEFYRGFLRPLSEDLGISAEETYSQYFRFY